MTHNAETVFCSVGFELHAGFLCRDIIAGLGTACCNNQRN